VRCSLPDYSTQRTLRYSSLDRADDRKENIEKAAKKAEKEKQAEEKKQV